MKGKGDKMNIVCYSGGHSSALVAVEAVRKYGKGSVVLLNHDISAEVEHADIKLFKKEVADYLGLPITYANMEGYEEITPLKLVRKLKGFQFQPGNAICTYNLKTKPFYKYLENIPKSKDVKILYGFDDDEDNRIQRRRTIINAMGYGVEFPLAEWERTITEIEEIGIERPMTYKIFKHANCVGCLKAGRQHWYIVYCLYPHIFEEAVQTEKEIGFSIIKDIYLKDLIPKYKEMQSKGICPSEKENPNTFWARVESTLPEQTSFLPCDCSI